MQVQMSVTHIMRPKGQMSAVSADDTGRQCGDVENTIEAIVHDHLTTHHTTPHLHPSLAHVTSTPHHTTPHHITPCSGLMHHVDWVTTFTALAQGNEFKGSGAGKEDQLVRFGDGVNQWAAINGLSDSPR